MGSIRHAQMDYLFTTRGGVGGYKTIVLAPASVQEIHDLVQLAFHLADRYCNPVVVLSDGILGLIAEPLEARPLDFGLLPEKDWALKGRDSHRDGESHFLHSTPGAVPPRGGFADYTSWLEHMEGKFQQMTDSELRYEAYQLEDAELLLVAYGYVARVCKEAISMARADGLKAGLLRPITLWPFPYDVLRDKLQQGCGFLVVEDSLGQLVEDVRIAAQGQTEVHFLGLASRHLTTDGGMILPGKVLGKIRKLL